MPNTYQAQFAKLWLEKLGNQILINGQDFFKIENENIRKLEFKQLRTFLNKGQQLLDDSEIAEIITITLADLKKKFGYSVYKIYPVKPWKKFQKDILVIGKIKPGMSGEINESSFAKRGCVIEWDRKNKLLRGVGDNFGTPEGQYTTGDITPWVPYGTIEKKYNNLSNLVVRENYASITDDLERAWKGENLYKGEIINIKELPVMITEDGMLICFPKTAVLPKILIVGKSGKGKSYTLSSLIGRVIYIYQDHAGLLNDSLNQFYDMMYPMDQKGFIHELHRVGNEPRQIAAVLLYMSCPNLNIEHESENIGYRLVISFKDFLYRYGYYSFGVNRWDIGKPEKYLTKEVINELDKCTTIEQVRDTLMEIIPNAQDEKKGEAMRNMINKWCAAWESVFRSQFTYNLFRNEIKTNPVWTVKLKDGETLTGHPFLVCTEAGLFPIINNYLAKTKPIAKKQMADLINKTVEWQMLRGEEKRKRLWIAVDELKDFLGKKGSGDELYEALDYLFTQGRFNRLGFIGNVQEYTKLSPAMRANSTHLFVFELQTKEERTAVAGDYNLERAKIDQMAELKTFQCLLITKEKVIIYDKDGGRKEVEGGIWRGKVLPPLTVHKTPK